MATVSIPKRTHDLFQEFNAQVGFSSPQEAVSALLVVCRELGRDQQSGLRIKSSPKSESSIAVSELFDSHMESVREEYQENSLVDFEVKDELLSRANDPLVEFSRHCDYGTTEERLSAMMSLALVFYKHMGADKDAKINVPVADRMRPMGAVMRAINLRSPL